MADRLIGTNRLDGLDELMKKLKAEPNRFLNATESALFIEGEQTMTAAKRLVPVDEGVLRASGHVRLPEVTDDEVQVEIGFGGPAGSGNRGESNDEDVGYAVYVHEDLTAYHPVGQAKYLEQPVTDRASGFAARIAKRIERRLTRRR